MLLMCCVNVNVIDSFPDIFHSQLASLNKLALNVRMAGQAHDVYQLVKAVETRSMIR